MPYTAKYRSPMGEILLAADEAGLTGLWFEGQKYYACSLGSEHREEDYFIEENHSKEENHSMKITHSLGEDRSVEDNHSIEEARFKEKELPVFDAVKTWLDIYFSGKEPDFTPPLHLTGSPFRLSVWKLLQQIPYGKTMTYGELARRIAGQRGLPHMSAQAVGGAVGHNPISIIVPCHRVVGSDGSLTGYAGGVDKKQRLLALEGVDVGKLFVPIKGTAL